MLVSEASHCPPPIHIDDGNVRVLSDFAMHTTSFRDRTATYHIVTAYQHKPATPPSAIDTAGGTLNHCVKTKDHVATTPHQGETVSGPDAVVAAADEAGPVAG